METNVLAIEEATDCCSVNK